VADRSARTGEGELSMGHDLPPGRRSSKNPSAEASSGQLQTQINDVRNDVKSLERKQQRESKAIIDQLKNLSNKMGSMHDQIKGNLSESWVFSSNTNPLAA